LYPLEAPDISEEACACEIPGRRLCPAIFMHEVLHNDENIVGKFLANKSSFRLIKRVQHFFSSEQSQNRTSQAARGTIARLLGLFLMLKYFDNIKAHPGLMRLPSQTDFHSSAPCEDLWSGHHVSL
jgi:hypothetical protein